MDMPYRSDDLRDQPRAQPIALGAWMQAITVAVSTLGSVFAVGGHVQAIRDDLHAVQAAAEKTDKQLVLVVTKLDAISKEREDIITALRNLSAVKR